MTCNSRCYDCQACNGVCEGCDNCNLCVGVCEGGQDCTVCNAECYSYYTACSNAA
jgi:hypothetical protein